MVDIKEFEFLVDYLLRKDFYPGTNSISHFSLMHEAISLTRPDNSGSQSFRFVDRLMTPSRAFKPNLLVFRFYTLLTRSGGKGIRVLSLGNDSI